jgi:hypothetical protein
MRHGATRARAAALGCALVALAGVLASCGEDAAAGGSGPEADRSAAQILADARVALGRVHSLRLKGDFEQKQGHTVIEVSVVVPGTVDFGFTQGSLHGEFIAVGQQLFVKAPQAFWAASGAKQSTAYADRWVSLPLGASQLGALLDVSDRDKLADCLVGEFGGALSKQGTATVNGRRTVVLVAKGGVPGTTPGRLYVAADGAPLPLRLEQTGPGMAGGTHTCRGGGLTTNTADTVRGTVDFSAYDGSVSVSAPKDALDAGGGPPPRQ